MTNVVEMTLAAILGLAANFHAGLDNLNNKNYDKAIAGFSAVLSASPLATDMKELSLLYRAEAYAAKGEKEKGLQDAATLIKTTSDAGIRSKALALYTGQGGVVKDLRPKVGPKATLDKFFEALRSSDMKAARDLISGPLLQILDRFEQGFAAESERSFLAEMGRNLNDVAFVSEDISDTNQTATLAVSVDHGRMTFTLGLVQRAGQWSFSTLEGVQNERAKQRGGRRAAASMMSNLSQIGKALAMYAMDHDEALPDSLDGLKDYIGNLSVCLCTDPATGKQQRFLYRPGLKASHASDTMVAASPFVVDGRRNVLFLDASATVMTEDEFVRKAAEQKWALPGLVKKEDVGKEVAVEAAALIGRLGDGDFKTRDAARKRLKEIGAAARPFLLEQRNHSDPEVRIAIQELLR